VIAAAIACALLAAAPAQPARRPARRPPRPAMVAAPVAEPAPPARADRARGTGQVVQVTAARAYLDAGAEDGLPAGEALEVWRGAALAGRCTVDLLAPHHASCPATGLRPGDTFRFTAAAPAPAPRLLPPPPGEAELQRRLTAVVAAPLPLVEYRAPERTERPAPRTRTADVTLRGDVWHASIAGTSERAGLEVAIRDAELGAGVRLDLDARAERWLRRDAPRFRPRDDTQLYLWQAQLTATPGALLLSAGRVLPWTVPGATVFDGALAGARGALGATRVEAGAFGGLVPEPDTTAATSSRSTGGGYWILDRPLGRGAGLRQEGRVAVVRSPELGTRVEGSATGRLYLALLDLSGEAHLGAGGKVEAKGRLDAARVDLTLRPLPGLTVGGTFRHAGLAWPQPLDPAAFPGRSRSADGFASLALASWLRLGATGGFSRDVGSGLERRWVGPEVSLPRLLAGRGGLSVGYLEESGWLEGRSAYAQLSVQPWTAMRLLLRGSWAEERSLGVDRHEIGLLAGVFTDLGSRVALRLSVMGRGAFDLAGEGAARSPYGVTGHAAVAASY
jgi:hypothetical protein